MVRSGDVAVVAAVVHELRVRDALEIAVMDREDNDLVEILAFVIRHIGNYAYPFSAYLRLLLCAGLTHGLPATRYTNMLLDVAFLIVGSYALGQSMVVDEQLTHLRTKLVIASS